ncbi:F-box protein with a domain protein [Rhynchospora pubera]|uniref:F-box protein with a domain protein n=1 Tax=Rhynchospora pubera TaxID=906938 RepID=A0AAV8GZ45_9POAL|nr:F-box protein with a domain protein [Rhynchospora pubera]
MASLRVQNLHLPAIGSTKSTRRRLNYCRAAINFPSNLSPKGAAAFQNLLPVIKLDELAQNQQYTVITEITKRKPLGSPKESRLLVAKLQTIAEAVADRVEMHDIIGRQRNNWNHLFLHSINSFVLSASLMTGISASLPSDLLALKLSSMLLLSAAGGMMLIVNKIQPSQLAEEQRNATRLWKQLGRDIDQMLSKKSNLTKQDVNLAMDKVLALDKAYPLPLLPGMLEKFPEHVEPTCWWPKKQIKQNPTLVNQDKCEGNGWSQELEEAMTGLKNVLKMKDESYYVELGKLVLGINKGLAVSGPAIAGLAAIATGFVDAPIGGSWAPVASIVGGALVAVLNTFEHGAQLGMIFEIFRNCPGLYQKIQEEIDHNLSEPEVELRENGEVFATRVALQLGRSVSELKDFAVFASPKCKVEDMKEFASKLF